MPAKLQLGQLPPFLALATLLITALGLTGAAFAWTARTVVDLVMGLLAADWLIGARMTARRTWTLIVLSLVVTAALGIPILQSAPFTVRLGGAAGCLALAGAVALGSWRGMVQRER